MSNIFLLVLTYLALVNIAGVFVMVYDKILARSANGSRDRLPEALLFFTAIIGGSAGVLAGMFFTRHKTQKPLFLLGIPILLLQQILLLQSYSFYF